MKFCAGPYQEEERVIVMISVIWIVHTEGSINVAQVVMVFQLLKRGVYQLRLPLEALPHMVT